METQRQLLEELDVLEWAVTQRFRRNPTLTKALGLNKSSLVLTGTPARPYKETLTQQHELKFFARLYASNQQRAKKGFDFGAVKTDVQKLRDPKRRYDYLLLAIEEVEAQYPTQSGPSAANITDQYALYLSCPVEDSQPRRKKRKFFLAVASAHVGEEINQMFTASELYGKFVDFTALYAVFQALDSSSMSYVEYLKRFLEFDGTSSKLEYVKYLEALLGYLEKFYLNLHPFAKIEYPEFHDPSSLLEDGAVDSNGEVYCKACDKMFTKYAVYVGHLNGKKHKKHAAASKDSKSDTLADKKSALRLLLQHKITHVSTLLQQQLEDTINEHCRRASLSERERMLEMLAFQDGDSDYTVVDSDADEQSDDPDLDSLYAKDLPLGPDGIPIPLWLYKLQGLHRTYSCEICGNFPYKGRLQFNRHFALAKHVHGLTCLGVCEEDVPLFANISSIAEVKELSNKVRRNKRKVEVVEEDAIEVEDEEGNIMSQKDYMELKKQGLI